MIMRYVAIFSVLFLLIGATLFLLLTIEKTKVSKAHAETYYADAIGKRQTDQCNRVHIDIAESPRCNRLTRNDPGVCTDIAVGSTNNTASYSISLDIRSNDGAAHTIDYGSDNNFCDSGRATIDAGTGYCSCIANSQRDNSTNISIPASGTQTITLNRASPYGYACGTYQMDFWINSVDGNTSCTYGNGSVVGASGLCETGTTCTGPTPTPTPSSYQISGNLYIDTNKNGFKDVGEVNYTGVAVAMSQGTITTRGDGTYTISNLTPGTYTFSSSFLPSGYYYTYPLNGPPPSFQVTVGPACTTNGANGSFCSAGNAINMNFGISNLRPWLQSTCGSIRDDNGITNPVPLTQRALVTSLACASPGIAFSGDGSASFSPGQSSSTNWIVGGLSYPEVYIPTSGTSLSLSYNNLLAKQQHARLTTTNLSTVCTLSSCILPANLPHGIYTATGNVTLNTYTFPANQNYIFLINGNLTIAGPILVPQGSGATALFSASGNIVVNASVGTVATSTQTSLEGIYSTDRSFIIPSAGACTDLRLNIGGNIITNAARTGGTFQNNRDLCANDATYPTVSFTQRLDLLLNTPTFLQQQESLTTEVAP